MNQVTISPNNKDTLLLVAVPNSSYNHCIDDGDLMYVNGGIRFLKAHEKFYNYTIIGLASSITEEQAKELFDFKDFIWATEQGGKLWGNALSKLKGLIESSGLTIGKDQDCLILKIN